MIGPARDPTDPVDAGPLPAGTAIAVTPHYHYPRPKRRFASSKTAELSSTALLRPLRRSLWRHPIPADPAEIFSQSFSGRETTGQLF